MVITIQYRKEHLVGFKDGEIILEVAEGKEVSPLFIKAESKPGSKKVKTKFVHLDNNLNIYVE